MSSLLQLHSDSESAQYMKISSRNLVYLMCAVVQTAHFRSFALPPCQRNRFFGPPNEEEGQITVGGARWMFGLKIPA